MRSYRWGGDKARPACVAIFALALFGAPAPALDKPTGAPLELSSVETEQSMPLVFLDPDGKSARCVPIKLHWNPKPDVGPDDDATSFTIDLSPDNPHAPIFIAQLWNASLASALAWQQPWSGARWSVIDVPPTDGTGIDAALAVGMIATSARRPYPDKTAVLGRLNPDGSIGAVARLSERLSAAAGAGMTRVIIPSVQRFDTDSSGQVVNLMRQAADLHLDCVPVDNLIQATEAAMNDPLPDVVELSATSPKYNDEVASYIDDFAHREQTDAEQNLKFAPPEADLAKYPVALAGIWHSVYADMAAADQAYRAGQVYVAYLLFSRANASMVGVNQLAGQTRASFDVKASLAESDDLRNHVHTLMNPPLVDRSELESALLVAEMEDWAYGINAALEGAQLVTKQTFSQRSDATDAEKERARQSLLFAIEQSKYLLNQTDFYGGLLAHVGKNPQPVDTNSAHLLPQLIPAQLAMAQIFTDGIRERANDLRVGLLFDPRLVAYVSVLREIKSDWDARQHKKDLEAAPTDAAPADGKGVPVKLNDKAAAGAVGFDPGNTYLPPHTLVAPTAATRKPSNAAECLIWVNHDCEIATLDEKYLRLNGAIDPATRAWHVKDRARLDALLLSAEIGARQGIAFAEKAEIDSAVLSLIYERATSLRSQQDDASALEALRHYWRCALLGNMCWQLGHSRKAQPVELSGPPDNPDTKKKAAAEDKSGDTGVAKNGEKAKTDVDNKTKPSTASVPKPAAADSSKETGRTKVVVDPEIPSQPKATEDTSPPVAPVAHDEAPSTHRALPVVIDSDVSPAPKALPLGTGDSEASIPVAPIARSGDYSPPATNAAPVIGPPSPPAARNDNADGHGDTF